MGAVFLCLSVLCPAERGKWWGQLQWRMQLLLLHREGQILVQGAATDCHHALGVDVLRSECSVAGVGAA